MRSCAELVQALGSSSSSSEQQRAAATELLALPMTPDAWIVAVGGIPNIVQMLTQHPSGQLAMRLLRHISSYTHTVPRTTQVASDDVVAALVALLRHSREDVCGEVTSTLLKLAFNKANKLRIVKAGAIAPLVQMLKPGYTVQAPAVEFVAFLLANPTTPNTRAEIIAAGAVPPLVTFLGSSSPAEHKYPALRALSAVCRDAEHTVAVVHAGIIPSLVRLLASPSIEMQAEAMQALGSLACNADLIVPIAEAGAIPPIVKYLMNKVVQVQEHAAVVLANLAYGRECRSPPSSAC